MGKEEVKGMSMSVWGRWVGGGVGKRKRKSAAWEMKGLGVEERTYWSTC